MTEERTRHAGGHGVRSEEDRIATGPLLAVGIGALVLFFVASFVTISYVRVKEGDRPPLPLPADFGRSKIGMLEQQIFELANRGELDRARKKEQLSSYGWVDRSAGVVHVPISRAMELVAEGVRAPAGPRAPRAPEGQP